MVLTCHMITRRDLQFAPRHVLLYQSYSCNSSWVWGMKGPPVDAFTELFEVQYFYSLRSVLSVQGSCQCRGTFLLFLYFSSFFFLKHCSGLHSVRCPRVGESQHSGGFICLLCQWVSRLYPCPNAITVGGKIMEHFKAIQNTPLVFLGSVCRHGICSKRWHVIGKWGAWTTENGRYGWLLPWVRKRQHECKNLNRAQKR